MLEHIGHSAHVGPTHASSHRGTATPSGETPSAGGSTADSVSEPGAQHAGTSYPTTPRQAEGKRRVRFADETEVLPINKHGDPIGSPRPAAMKTHSVEELPEKTGMYAKDPKPDKTPVQKRNETPEDFAARRDAYAAKRERRETRVLRANNPLPEGSFYADLPAHKRIFSEDAKALANNPLPEGSFYADLPAHKWIFHDDAKALGFIS